MACDAWNDVTAETITNCWKHADIQRDPIILRIPLTTSQKGWDIIWSFADQSSGVTLPQAEELLRKIFGNQYNDACWRLALKIVTETEPNEDVRSLIKNLQEKSCSANQLFVPTEYTHTAVEVGLAIEELERRKRIFDGTPSADSFIEPEGEREVEATPMRTDDELVAEVLRERAIESREIEEIEDDSESEGEPEPEMGVREMLVSISRLRRALLSWGDVCVHTAKMLAQVQDEVTCEEIRNARQTTLKRWFGAGHASE